jgi:hypothetical protein
MYRDLTYLLGCPNLCLQVSYTFAFTNYHQNSWVDTNKIYPPNFSQNYYPLILLYGTLDIEKHVETLVYDAGNLFAAVGGNLGLFLGFSCLSIIFGGINLLRRLSVKVLM